MKETSGRRRAGEEDGEAWELVVGFGLNSKDERYTYRDYATHNTWAQQTTLSTYRFLLRNI